MNKHTTDSDRLRSIVERIERLNEERKALANDIKDVYHEAKSAGFDPAVLREIIKRRAAEPGELDEFDALLGTYELWLSGGKEEPHVV